MEGQLRKSKSNKILSGVCGGLGNYLNVDPSIIRVIFVLAAFFLDGIGILIYLVLALVMPTSDGEVEVVIEDIISSKPDDNKGRNVLVGVILIVVGAYFLADMYFVWFDMDVIISAILILLGVYVIVKGRGGTNK